MYLFVNAKYNKNKVYEVRIKVFYTIGYKPKNGLAETHSLIYKNEFFLKLRYKLKVYNSRFSIHGLNKMN